jgi:alkenylglycerophosphocholine hydrolase
MALVVAAGAIDADPPSARPWFVVGLVFCLVGDVALLPAVDSFIVGLGAFLVGHICFLLGALIIGVHPTWMFGVVVAVDLVVAAFAGPRIVRGSASLAPAVAAYLLVIVTMSIAVGATGRVAGALGALAFTASDAVLGWDRFVRPTRHAAVVIMVTYHLALAGLVLALR